jgi:hypothetical protein
VLGLAIPVTERLDELEAWARTGASDLEEQASTLSPQSSLSNIVRNITTVRLIIE